MSSLLGLPYYYNTQHDGTKRIKSFALSRAIDYHELGTKKAWIEKK